MLQAALFFVCNNQILIAVSIFVWCLRLVEASPIYGFRHMIQGLLPQVLDTTSF